MIFVAVFSVKNKRYRIEFDRLRVPFSDEEWMKIIKKSKKIPSFEIKIKDGIGILGTNIKLETCIEP